MYRMVTITLIFLSLLALTACGASSQAPVQATAAEEEVVVEEAPAEIVEEEVVVEEAPAEMAEESAESIVYAVDADASQVVWNGEYTLRSTGHMGTIDISEGTLALDGSTLVGGEFTIDMTTIVVTDLTGGRANRLAGHLMNEDFFEANTFPTSVLTLKSAEPTGVENQYEITADLTIKGITNEISYITDVAFADDGALNATADIVFDRTQWNVVYNSGSIFDGLGDRVIKDEVTMQITLVAPIS